MQYINCLLLSQWPCSTYVNPCEVWLQLLLARPRRPFPERVACSAFSSHPVMGIAVSK